MSTKLLTLEDLQDWDRYRAFMKDRMKRYGGESTPVYITKEPIDFSVRGKLWKGRALLLSDPQSLALVKALRKAGVPCREGLVKLEDEILVVQGIDKKVVKSADKSLQRLKIGCRVRPEGEPLDAADGDGAAAPGSLPEFMVKARQMRDMDPNNPLGWNEIGDAAVEGAEEEEESVEVTAEALALWEELKAWVTAKAKDVFAKDPSLKAPAVPLISEASKLGANMRIEEATGLLQRVVALFDASAAAAPTVPPEAYAETHRYWQETMDELASEIAELKRAIVDAFRDAQGAGNPASSLARLDAVMRNIELGLGSALLAASKATSPADRSRAYRDVQAKLTALKKRVDNDPLLREIATNPFTTSNLDKKMRDFLTEVGKKLR